MANYAGQDVKNQPVPSVSLCCAVPNKWPDRTLCSDIFIKNVANVCEEADLFDEVPPFIYELQGKVLSSPEK